MASIDFKTIPANVPSMCIPRVFKNITRDRVAGVFRELDLGTIDRIDLVQKENEKGEKFQRAFIHFKTWHANPNANRAREMLLGGKEVKVIYDDPWFWKIAANKSTGSGTSERTGVRDQKPVIAFDESDQPSKPRRDKQKRRVKFHGPSVAPGSAKRPRSPSPPVVPVEERSPSPSPPVEEDPVLDPQCVSGLLPDHVEENKGVVVDYTRLPMPPAPKKKRVVKIPSISSPAQGENLPLAEE